MNAIESIKARLPNGNKAQAELVYDQHATNPREGGSLGTILIAPRKAHWVAANPDVAVDTSIRFGDSPYGHWDNLRREQLNLKKSDIAIAYPITAHTIGGEISLSLGYKSGWGYDVVGFIYITKETLRKEYGVKRITSITQQRAKNCLQDELDMLTAWLNGDCYGWQIKEYTLTDDGLDWKEVGILDDCWGYFDKEHAIDDMKDMLNHLTATTTTTTTKEV